MTPGADGPLIRPGGGGADRLREIEGAMTWHREMMRKTHTFKRNVCRCGAVRGTAAAVRHCPHGEPPEVRVVIQVRGHVVPVDAYRAKIGRAIAAMKRSGVPEDEQGPVLERAVQEGPQSSREWEDVETWWTGAYDPDEVKFPTAAKLEQVEEKLGAAEARAVIRART